MPVIAPTSTDAVEQRTSYVPEGFDLETPHPNPLNAMANIEYSLPTRDRVSIKVYNETSQLVRTLFEGVEHASGNYTTHFDASRLASGVYFIRLSSENGYADTERAVVVK
jgi:hypothetical protein